MTTHFITTSDGVNIAYDVLLLADSKNKIVMEWLVENGDSVVESGLRVEINEGLTHQQEFSHIDIVYPIVRLFFELW